MEIIQNLPEIYDALMTLVETEHRPIIHELFISFLTLLKAVYKQQT
jgi:hypothetical protein